MLFKDEKGKLTEIHKKSVNYLWFFNYASMRRTGNLLSLFQVDSQFMPFILLVFKTVNNSIPVLMLHFNKRMSLK